MADATALPIPVSPLLHVESRGTWMPSTDDMTLPALRRLLRPLGREAAAVDARVPAARADGLDAMKAVLAEGQDGALIHERALVLVRSGVSMRARSARSSRGAARRSYGESGHSLARRSATF